jgi:3-deoxy-D-manno-octulosonate 8-phosphate phosphatase (KDO 8-P phosphatase)
VQAALGVTPEQTLAMGDDLPDLGLAAGAAVLCAPADARQEVRERADLVTRARGGDGAVREVAEALLEAQGAWTRLLEQWSE